MRSSDSISDRPLSIMSNGTVKSSGSKSRFSFFGSSKKEKRSSISLSFTSKRSNPPSIASPTTPSYTTANMDFDDLIRSGCTKKVSLTPNRLRSIEIKDEADDITPWDKYNTSKHKKKPSLSSSPPPPVPPLPRTSREHISSIPEATTNSPPLTPASSVASRPSQRSRHSIIYEERSEKSTRSSLKSYSTSEDLLVEETMNIMRNPSKMSTASSFYSNHGRRSTAFNEDTVDIKPPMNKPRFERPSSMVVKRASMGSRPPSFHESALEIMGNTLIATAAGSAEFASNKALDELRLQYETRRSITPKKILEEEEEEQASESSQVEQGHPRRYQDMIYVIPPTTTTIPRPSIANRSSKARTMDKGCQTDPVHILSIIDDHKIEASIEDEDDDHKIEAPIDDGDDDDEEWFLEEEDWNDTAEEEKIVVEWLLGNV
jgi:hypothetical protein